jgi:hypothetical protein
MNVADIAKEETYTVRFISVQLLILCFSGRSNQSSEVFYTTELYTFLIYQVVSNSQLLVFHSTQRHITLSGNATNWNNTGYYEAYYPSRKFGVNCMKKSVMESPGQCNN